MIGPSSQTTRLWILALPVAWLLLLLAAPLAIVLLIAFARPADGVPPYSLAASLDNLSLVATDPLYRGALLRSVRVAGLSTLVCLLMGFPMALAITRVIIATCGKRPVQISAASPDALI